MARHGNQRRDLSRRTSRGITIDRKCVTIMKIETLDDADAVSREGARIIAADARDAVNTRGRFIIAVSGGHTPWMMMRALAKEDVPWENVHLVQVDERVAPAESPDRNLAHLRESLIDHVPLRPE